MAGNANNPWRLVAPSGQTFDGLLFSTAWGAASAPTISYAFTDNQNQYAYADPNGWHPAMWWASDFQTLTTAAQNVARKVMDIDGGNANDDAFSVGGFTLANFVEGSKTTSMIRFGGTDSPPQGATGNGEPPFGNAWSGDIILDVNTVNMNDPKPGQFAYYAIMHELGHALGLKHPHEQIGYYNNGPLPWQYDGSEFTVMSYNSATQGPLYPGGPIFRSGFAQEAGHLAQTFMMLDIAALQHLYGANFNTNSGNDTYTWNSSTGNALINGNISLSSDINDIIFMTLWDGGGTDTYDLSNYTTNLKIDLAPGSYSDFGQQKAHLGSQDSDTPVEFRWARGNVFNALQYQGDVRSLIENAYGGSGDDVIKGNQAGNLLEGRNGADAIYGMTGSDSIYAGVGNDWIDAGLGNDWLVGGSGADIFHFVMTGETGDDTIGDFTDGVDKLEFLTSEWGSKSAILAAASQHGSDVWITHSNGAIVDIDSFTLANLGNADLLLV